MIKSGINNLKTTNKSFYYTRYSQFYNESYKVQWELKE